ncbi:MAG: hypothetical protein AAB594_00155 [Patescibacteria group bacterium]
MTLGQIGLLGYDRLFQLGLGKLNDVELHGGEEQSSDNRKDNEKTREPGQVFPERHCVAPFSFLTAADLLS